MPDPESDPTPNLSSKEAHSDALPTIEIFHERELDLPVTEVKYLTQELLSPETGSSKVESVPQPESVIPVTGVRLNCTQRGLEVILETPGRREPQVYKTRYGETLAMEVLKIQLRLPDEQAFRQDNPVEGIASVEVVQQNPNSIRVTVTGTERLPSAEVPSPEGVALSVTAPTAAAQEAPEPEPLAEEPPAPTTPERPEPSHLLPQNLLLRVRNPLNW
jgi:hypothetical protein